MDNAREVRENDNKILRIFADSDPMNPRKEFDQVGTMVVMTKIGSIGNGYCLGDEALTDENKSPPSNLVSLPVYVYDHGFICLSTEPFGCPWDSGRIGYIYASLESLKTMGIDPTDTKLINEILKGEIEIYSDYLSGDVYGYEIVKKVYCKTCNHFKEEHVDSCWGFYGSNFEKNGLYDQAGIGEELDKWTEV